MDRRRLTQGEAARLLGMCERTFRRYLSRHAEHGEEGLLDKRLSHPSHRKAPVYKALAMIRLYRERYDGWNVKHFYGRYRGEGVGRRSYTWVKTTLQAAGRR